MDTKGKPCCDSRSPGPDFNSGPAEHEAGMITTQPRISALGLNLMMDFGYFPVPPVKLQNIRLCSIFLLPY